MPSTPRRRRGGRLSDDRALPDAAPDRELRREVAETIAPEIITAEVALAVAEAPPGVAASARGCAGEADFCFG
jgi:hypothetical protein